MKPKARTKSKGNAGRKPSSGSDSPIRRIVRGDPMAVLIDRSKDYFAGRRLSRLCPANTFLTTENYGRLTARLLSGYQVLMLSGNSTATYTGKELEAIETFVRGGGGLVIVGCSGGFEWMNSQPAAEMSGNAVGELFGYQFLSATGLPANVEGWRGYDRSRLSLTDAGRELGLKMGEIPVSRPGPLATPRTARVLMCDRKTGQAVCATSRIGRGRVLVCNDTGLWLEWRQWASSHWIMAVAPKGRSDRALPAYEVGRKPRKEAGGTGIVVRYTSETRGNVARTLEMAEQVRAQLIKLLRPKRKVRKWTIDLQQGCGDDIRGGAEHEVLSGVGAGLSDSAMAAALTRHFAKRCVWALARSGLYPYIWPAVLSLEVMVLERLGFGDRAGELRQSVSGGPRVNLARYYFDYLDPIPGHRRLWLDIGEEFGPDALRRFLKSLPEKDPGKGVDRAVFGDFEVFAFLLASALGERVHDWLEERGDRVRRVPLEKPGSDELLGSLERLYGRLLIDPSQTASERTDALSALVNRLGDQGIGQCVRKASSKRPPIALPAIAKLMMMRDRRASEFGRPWLKNPDPGLTAVAALLMVFEGQDRAAADVLVRVAREQDVRFQLSAGHALKLAGDSRAARFAFDRLGGCRLRVVEDGHHKVYATVDGYDVASVFCEPMLLHEPYGQVHSDYYVAEVYTATRWRRRGLARLCMERSLAHRWDRLCATTSLGTGTRNVAHALYRSFGLIDFQRGVVYDKAIRPEPSIQPPKGIRLRRARAEDATAAAELLNTHFEAQPWERCRLRDWPGHKIAWVAYQGAQMMGVATANSAEKPALLEHVAVAPVRDEAGKPVGKCRAVLGHALLNAVHRDLLRKKVTAIRFCPWFCPLTDGVAWALHRQGYGSRLDGGVFMRRINDLAQYLDETSPVLERRLAESKKWTDWQGRILLEGDELSACLEIDRGKIRALPAARRENAGNAGRTRLARPSISVHADDQGIQRMVSGIEHPFEEYLQLSASVTPHLSNEARDLLEALFPKVIRE